MTDMGNGMVRVWSQDFAPFSKIKSAHEAAKPDQYDSDYDGANDERHGNYRRDGFYGRPDGGWDRVIGGITLAGPAPMPPPTGYLVRGGAFDEHGRLRLEVIATARRGLS